MATQPFHYCEMIEHTTVIARAALLARMIGNTLRKKEMQPIECTHGDVLLRGAISRPQEKGPLPAVLVMHSALGIHHMTHEVAQRLASLGYLAVATDMYGADADISAPEKAGALYMAMLADGPLLRARCALWFDTVAALPDVDASRIAAIGYCFGGQCVLELARSGRDAKAVVSFHGGLTTHAPALPGAIKGEVVAYCGQHDPFAPPEHTEQLRAELIAAKAHWQITTFGDAAHGFTDPKAEGGMPGIEYNAMADRMSWAGTVALLKQVLV
jgi:dienelactone hydrolase